MNIIGTEILNQNLQQPLKEVKIQSFIFNGQFDEISSIYLKFDGWIHLFFDDGPLFVREGMLDHQRIIKSNGNTIEWHYVDPVSCVADFDSIINQRLIRVITEEEKLKFEFENLRELIFHQEKLPDGKFGRTLIEIK
jgi:hypothetical protein